MAGIISLKSVLNTTQFTDSGHVIDDVNSIDGNHDVTSGMTSLPVPSSMALLPVMWYITSVTGLRVLYCHKRKSNSALILLFKDLQNLELQIYIGISMDKLWLRRTHKFGKVYRRTTDTNLYHFFYKRMDIHGAYSIENSKL